MFGAMERYEPAWLLFASDAKLLMVLGVAFLFAAVVALAMDRRRHNRDRLSAADRVGWMPWTMVFLIGATLGLGLIAASLAA